ncbi:MAG: hypothetical protein ACO1QB_07420 [Verrucomicrobiales bacterium]
MNPQIQIPVAALKPVLQGMSKVINKRSTLPVLGCLLIESTFTGIRFSGTSLYDYLTTKTNMYTVLPMSAAGSLTSCKPYAFLKSSNLDTIDNSVSNGWTIWDI